MTEYNWKDFLNQWRKEQIAVDDRFSYFYGDMRKKFPDQFKTNYEGASEAEIAQVEARLGKNLPPSYRQFLLYTNGWGNLSFSSRDFWPVANIQSYAKKHLRFVETWKDKIEDLNWRRHLVPVEASVIYGQARRLVTTTHREQLANTLVIGGFLSNRSYLYLLNPSVINSEGEWEAWYLDTMELLVFKYESFWEMMQTFYREFHERSRVLFLTPEYITDDNTGQLIPVYAWKDFLTAWSKALLEPGKREEIFFEDDDVSQQFLESQWIGFPPAIEFEIVRAEERLGINLPPSYRQFLLVTNGLPLYHQSFLLELWKLQEVDWAVKKDCQGTIEHIIHKVEKGTFQISDLPDEEYYDYSKQDGYDIRLDHFTATLEIGGFDGNDYYLLNPLAINQDGEWEAWTWYKEGGAERYPSFWEMMQEVYYRTILSFWQFI